MRSQLLISSVLLLIAIFYLPVNGSCNTIQNGVVKPTIKEIARQKIYLGRAYKAFISVIEFNRNERPTFHKINSMSDLTGKEKMAMYNSEISNFELDKYFKVNEKPSAPIMDLIETVKSKQVYNLAQIDKDGAYERRGLERANSNKNNNERNKIKRSTTFDDRKLTTLEDLYADGFKPTINYDSESSSLLSSYSSSNNIFDTSFDLDNNNDRNFFNNFFSSVFNDNNKQPLAVIENDLPNEIFMDHRRTNCFGPIKNQAICASCYIHSTLSLYEFQYCKETSNKLIFSEQYLLDCGERASPRLPGCRGGTELMVENFISRFGLELSSNYHYRARSDECPYQPADLDESKMGQYKLRETSLFGVSMEEWEEKLENNPIAVHVLSPDDFAEYGGGIESGNNCNPSQGHGMVIVGSGRQGEVDYWILRNSYGEDWGEEGYWRLDKRATNCFGNNGLGLQIRGSRVFDGETNPDYDDKYIKQRKEDVEQGRTINKNPFSYVDISELILTKN